MLKAALRLALLTLVVVFATHSKAEANCFFPHAFTTTYYAFIDDSPGWEGTLWACQEIIISPMHPHHWGAIGGTTRDCDGNVTSWGDTTSCTGSSNTERTFESCPPICE
jgi:hypothetical protein